MDPRAGLDWGGKSRPHRDSIPGPSSPYRLGTAASCFTCEKTSSTRIIMYLTTASTLLRQLVHFELKLTAFLDINVSVLLVCRDTDDCAYQIFNNYRLCARCRGAQIPVPGRRGH